MLLKIINKETLIASVCGMTGQVACHANDDQYKPLEGSADGAKAQRHERPIMSDRTITNGWRPGSIL